MGKTHVVFVLASAASIENDKYNSMCLCPMSRVCGNVWLHAIRCNCGPDVPYHNIRFAFGIYIPST